MAVAYVQELVGGHTVVGAGATQAMTLAASATPGNTVIQCFVTRNTSIAGCSIADSRGNPWVIDAGPFNNGNQLIYIASTRMEVGTLLAGDTITDTFGTAPNQTRLWWVEEFSGLQTTAGYLDQTARSANPQFDAFYGSIALAKPTSAQLAIGLFCIFQGESLAADPNWSQFTTGVQDFNSGDGFGKAASAQYNILPATSIPVMTCKWSTLVDGQESVMATYKSGATDPVSFPQDYTTHNPKPVLVHA